MKKIISIIALLAFMAGASMAVAGLVSPFFDADGKPKGCTCCVKGTFVLAQSEADCEKLGGKVVKDPNECKPVK